MCGIAGVLGVSAAEGKSLASAMAAALRHRGPDASGAWAEDGVALGHCRLSIIDLSPAGAQPMRSSDGRWALSYNGELYNYKELRGRLAPGTALRGGSDTEVLLELVAQKGVEEALGLSNGMFALALWDRRERRLTLARDRMGEKPLYYGRTDNGFVFASELKAFDSLPGFRRVVDGDALALYFRHNCVPAPYSIFQGIRKLPPATMLHVAADGAAGKLKTYWDVKAAAERGAAAPLRGGDASLVERADALLRGAVKLRMEADVPLGAFLSGGIDSSLVAALMQEQASRPVRTFTIGFPDLEYDESKSAKAVAAHLKTEHTEFPVTERDALEVVPKLAEMFDEPFADSSQIPTYLVAKLARKQVTVALSGDGGDELFGGYNRYLAADRLWERLHRTPRALRDVAAAAIGAISPAAWDRVARAVSPALPASLRLRTPGQKLRKLGEVMGAGSLDEFYRRLTTHWEPGAILADGRDPAHAVEPAEGLDPVSRLMYYDLRTYLPDDILAKVDRATMAVGLESRVPLLDHRVVEFACTLPLEAKIRGGETKWILRRVLERYVPPALVDRPKMGFAVPLAAWLRGPLREWAEDLLSERSLRSSGYLNPEPVRKRWAQHLSGKGDWQDPLWDVLMFESWRRRWLA